MTLLDHVQCRAVDYDDSNELKYIDGDELTIKVITLVKEPLHYEVWGKGKCHQS